MGDPGGEQGCRRGRRAFARLAAGCAALAAGGWPSPRGAAADGSAAPGEPTVLLVGDSHTYGAFGARLHARLAESGRFAVVSVAAGGATWDTWLEERPEGLAGYRLRASRRGERGPRELEHRLRGTLPTLDALLAAHDPVALVVALGTNRPRGPALASAARFADRARRARPARPLVFVGPPSFGVDGARPARQALEALARREGVAFVDGAAFNAKAPLPADNPHFGPADARSWADALAPAVVAGLRQAG